MILNIFARGGSIGCNVTDESISLQNAARAPAARRVSQGEADAGQIHVMPFRAREKGKELPITNMRYRFQSRGTNCHPLSWHRRS